MRSLFAVFLLYVPILAMAGPIGSRSASSSAVDSSGNSALNITAPTFIATDGTTGYKLKASSLLCYSSDVSCSTTAGATAKYDGTDFIVNVPTGKSFKWKVNGTNELTLSTAGALVATGAVSGSNLSGTNTGDVTLGAVGSSPSANGASLSGQILTLQPADAANPGVVTAGAQTLAGAKTLSSAPLLTAGLSLDAGSTNTLTLVGGKTFQITSSATSGNVLSLTSGSLANALLVDYGGNITSQNSVIAYGLIAGAGGVKASATSSVIAFHGCSAATAFDAPSTTLGCSCSSAITVTGAVLGDQATIGLSADMSATNGSYSAVVTAADTMKACFCTSGTTINPASVNVTVCATRG